MKILSRLFISPIILLMGVVSTLLWVIKGPGQNGFDIIVFRYIQKIG
jgi:hypothetical protein